MLFPCPGLRQDLDTEAENTLEISGKSTLMKKDQHVHPNSNADGTDQLLSTFPRDRPCQRTLAAFALHMIWFHLGLSGLKA